MAFKGLCQTNMGAIIFTTCKLQRYDIHSNIDVDSFSQAMFWVKKLWKKVWKKNAIEGCAMHSVHFHETERGSKLLGSTNSHLI